MNSSWRLGKREGWKQAASDPYVLLVYFNLMFRGRQASSCNKILKEFSKLDVKSVVIDEHFVSVIYPSAELCFQFTNCSNKFVIL